MRVMYDAEKHPDKQERIMLTEQLMNNLDKLYNTYPDQLVMPDDLMYIPAVNKFGRVVELEVNYDTGYWFYYVAFGDSCSEKPTKYRFTDVIHLDGEFEKI